MKGAEDGGGLWAAARKFFWALKSSQGDLTPFLEGIEEAFNEISRFVGIAVLFKCRLRFLRDGMQEDASKNPDFVALIGLFSISLDSRRNVLSTREKEKIYNHTGLAYLFGRLVQLFAVHFCQSGLQLRPPNLS